MKYFWLLILCAVMSFTVAGQQISPMFYKRILLKHKRYTLQSITEVMRAQSGISFSYNAQSINPNTKIKIKGGGATVAEILAMIKKKTGISYKIINQRHIIYVASADKKKKVPKPKRIKHPKKNTLQEISENSADTAPVTPVSDIDTSTFTTNIKKDSAAGAGTVIVGDSNLVMAYYSGGGGSGGGGGGSNETNKDDAPPPHIPERKWRSGARSFKGDGSGPGNALNALGNNVLLAAGASADEVYYFNPTLKFGMRFIYGIASYNLGGGSNTWRYGLGASATIDEHWSLHFILTTGQSVSRNYTISYPDTSIAQRPLSVTSKLTRYGISTNYNFGNGFTVEGGLTFNSLKTNYTSNGNPVTLSNILPIGYDADEKYTGIKPPYTLGNTYSGNSTGNTKTWLGIQVSLLYQLRLAGE